MGSNCILVELIKGKSGKDNELMKKARKNYSLKRYNFFFMLELLNEWWKSKFFLLSIGCDGISLLASRQDFLLMAFIRNCNNLFGKN